MFNENTQECIREVRSENHTLIRFTAHKTRRVTQQQPLVKLCAFYVNNKPLKHIEDALQMFRTVVFFVHSKRKLYKNKRQLEHYIFLSQNNFIHLVL